MKRSHKAAQAQLRKHIERTPKKNPQPRMPKRGPEPTAVDPSLFVPLVNGWGPQQTVFMTMPEITIHPPRPSYVTPDQTPSFTPSGQLYSSPQLGAVFQQQIFPPFVIPPEPKIVPGIAYTPRGERSAQPIAMGSTAPQAMNVPVVITQKKEVARDGVTVEQTKVMRLDQEEMLAERTVIDTTAAQLAMQQRQIEGVETTFHFLELLAPNKRNASEELGDARELINEMITQGASPRDIKVIVRSTVFWFFVNMARYLVAALKGKRTPK